MSENTVNRRTVNRKEIINVVIKVGSNVREHKSPTYTISQCTNIIIIIN